MKETDVKEDSQLTQKPVAQAPMAQLEVLQEEAFQTQTKLSADAYKS